MDKKEFYLGAKKLGLKLKRREAEKEFAKMDANGGGVVLFDEFCVWYTGKINPEREIAKKPVCRKKRKRIKLAKYLVQKIEVHSFLSSFSNKFY